ncbi:glycosyltransferase [bacterium]|nr:glycosyltransferase [bacterium]
MSIPKRIFYVWGAKEPKRTDVNLCIKTWQYAMPDYEIIEINEDSTEYFNFQKELEENKWFRTVYERKMYAYVADYVRIKTLYDNGGIYLDTDVTTIKSFDVFLEEPAFVGLQSDKDITHDIFEPAILGAQRGNEFLKQLKNFYDNDIWILPLYSMPQIFGYIIRKNYINFPNKPRDKQETVRFDNLTIYPERYFIPFRYGEKFVPQCIKEDTHAIHWYNASWQKPEIISFLENKHKLSIEQIDALYPKYLKQTSKNSLLQNIFSIKKTNDRTEKVITLLGFKYHFKLKK